MKRSIEQLETVQLLGLSIEKDFPGFDDPLLITMNIDLLCFILWDKSKLFIQNDGSIKTDDYLVKSISIKESKALIAKHKRFENFK